MRRKALFSVFALSMLMGGSVVRAQKSTTALQMEKLGYVDVLDVDSALRVSLMYARADNFMGRVLYKDLREAYLHPEAAKSLSRAREILQAEHPHLGIIVYDAARPMHIQQQMWNAVSGTPKRIYVCNPKNGGGLHNYGMAVDVSLYNINSGDTLDMGTRIDFLGKQAHISEEDNLVAQGIISSEARENRRILRNVMRRAGFTPLKTEWWHFNYISRAKAKAHYKPIP